MTTSTLFIGIGGAGSNILNYLAPKFPQYDHLLINTDLASLQSNTLKTLHIGDKSEGCKGDLDYALQAVISSQKFVKEVIADYERVVLLAGLGGGTGTAVTPEIAQWAKQQGSKVFALVIIPFMFEGAKRKNFAEQSVNQLSAICDILHCFNNDDLQKNYPKTIGMKEAFKNQHQLIFETIKNTLNV